MDFDDKAREEIIAKHIADRGKFGEQTSKKGVMSKRGFRNVAQRFLNDISNLFNFCTVFLFSLMV